MTTHIKFDLRPDERGGHSLDWKSETLLRFPGSGALAKFGKAARSFSRADVVRWAVPVALSPYGHVLLHASAVCKQDVTLAFLGIGGAGKSTVAQQMKSWDWQAVSDDLLICGANGQINLLGEQVVREWCNEFGDNSDVAADVDYRELSERLSNRDHQKWIHLQWILFLDETRGDDSRFTGVRLTELQCFRRLIRYGFEGFRSPAVRRNQFLVYGVLSRQCRSALLRAPKGLASMQLALGELYDDVLSQLLPPTDEDGLPQ